MEHVCRQPDQRKEHGKEKKRKVAKSLSVLIGGFFAVHLPIKLSAVSLQRSAKFTHWSLDY
jgi:hypothetical protein